MSSNNSIEVKVVFNGSASQSIDVIFAIQQAASILGKVGIPMIAWVEGGEPSMISILDTFELLDQLNNVQDQIKR